MTVTLGSVGVTWNDGTSSQTSLPSNSLTNIDTTGSTTYPVSQTTFAVGTLQLMRTSGGTNNNNVYGQYLALYSLSGYFMSYFNNGTVLGSGNYGPPVVVTSNSTFSPIDYNATWWGNPNVPGGATNTPCTGTWLSRGQFFGRGLASLNHGNFVLMQRVA